MTKYLITGGYGFIGSNLISRLLRKNKNMILNLDKVALFSNFTQNSLFNKNSNYKFIKTDICNFSKVKKLINDFEPNVIFHLAAESHVDTSIKYPQKFIDSNIYGTFNMLNATRNFINKKNKKVIFIHISTDEVYGSLTKKEKSFTENSIYKPNSPYSASKAASDHLVRAWNKTYGIPAIITHCANNYGPWQHPEKLIPKTIASCINKKNIPIYGDGKNIREWIHVNDHIDALIKISDVYKEGEIYNIGSGIETSNLLIAKTICKLFNKKDKQFNYTNLITFTEDRLGHDFRYSINSNKINSIIKKNEFITLEKGLKMTIDWYLKNKKWINYFNK